MAVPVKKPQKKVAAPPKTGTKKVKKKKTSVTKPAVKQAAAKPAAKKATAKPAAKPVPKPKK